jgi:hypothetical protein
MPTLKRVIRTLAYLFPLADSSRVRVGLVGAKCAGPVGRGLFIPAPTLGVLTYGHSTPPVARLNPMVHGRVVRCQAFTMVNLVPKERNDYYCQSRQNPALLSRPWPRLPGLWTGSWLEHGAGSRN